MRDIDKFIEEVETNRGKYKNVVKVHSQLKWIYSKAIPLVKKMLTDDKKVGVTFVEKIVDELNESEQYKFLGKINQIEHPKKKDFEDVLNQIILER